MQNSELDHFIYLCNNIFYNNYLENGVLNSKSEIEQKIKTETCEAFVNIHDAEDREIITQRIANTKIDFVYQTCGPLSSVDMFLENLAEQRSQRFIDKYGSTANIQYLLTLFNNASKQGKSFDKVIDDNIVVFSECFYHLSKNINKTDIKDNQLLAQGVKKVSSNPDLLNKFIHLMGQYVDYVEIQKNTLHDNPKINADLIFVRDFVEKTKTEIKAKCKQYNLSYKDVTERNNMGIELDPVVRRLHPECFEQKNSVAEENTFSKSILTSMLRFQDKGFICGYFDQGTVYLPSSLVDEKKANEYKVLTDDTVIHEVGHAVTQGGFLKDNQLIVNDYNDYEKYDAFEEVINDWIALLAVENREKQNKPALVSNKKTRSIYSDLFPMMSDFLWAYLPELKKIRLGKDPVLDFMKIIGKENFDQLASLCTHYLQQVQNLKICAESDRLCLSLKECLPAMGENFTYYGQLRDIEHLRSIIDVDIQRITNKLKSLAQMLAEQKFNKEQQYKKSDAMMNFGGVFTTGKSIEQEKSLVSTEMEIVR